MASPLLISVGEIGILYDIKRTATVRAKTKCTLAVLTSDELNEKLEKYPQIKGSLSSRAQERLERLERERAKAGRRVGSESSEKPAELRKVWFYMSTPMGDLAANTAAVQFRICPTDHFVNYQPLEWPRAGHRTREHSMARRHRPRPSHLQDRPCPKNSLRVP